MEPQVPGPGLPRPPPKKVAMVQAHRVFFWTGELAGSRLFVMGFAGLVLSAAEPLRGVLVSWELPDCASFIMEIRASRAQAFEVFEDFGIEDGGADLVDAGGPLAEVDFATAVGAEGEVFTVEQD